MAYGPGEPHVRPRDRDGGHVHPAGLIRESAQRRRALTRETPKKRADGANSALTAAQMGAPIAKITPVHAHPAETRATVMIAELSGDPGTIRAFTSIPPPGNGSFPRNSMLREYLAEQHAADVRICLRQSYLRLAVGSDPGVIPSVE
jgi:hypothetical protein